MGYMKEVGASLVGNGYRIVPIPKGRKGPVIDAWQRIDATLDDVKTWAANGYAEGNIGVLTANTPAVDLDIYDATLADEMERYVISLLGEAPVRVGRAPKRLLVFRTDEPFGKMLQIATDKAGTEHRVEVLGRGQQFVAYGIHPDTNKPYTWTSFDDISDVEVDDLPLLTRETAQTIIDEFVRRATLRGWAIGKASSASNVATDDDDAFGSIKTPLRINDEQIRNALNYAGDRESYDDWVLVGMALHHQFQGEDRGLELWHEWSQGAANYDDTALDAKWQSFSDARQGGSTVTMATFVKKAREAREAESRKAYDDLQMRVRECEDSELLFNDVCRRIGKTELAQHQRDILAKLIQEQGKKITGARVNISTVRNAIKAKETRSTKVTAERDELEIRLATAVLDRHFKGGKHLARFAKTWWFYERGLWRKAEDEFVESKSLETLRYLRKTGSEEVASFIADMEDNAKVGKINGAVTVITSLMVRLLARDSAHDPLRLTVASVPSVINCANCELWFEFDGSMERREHNADSMLTAQIACDFDPGAECPTWDEAIDLVFRQCEDAEGMKRHFYEVMGYILQPARDIPTWVMLKGPGGNGKSFLLDIISTLMGRRSISNVSLDEISRRQDSHFTDSLQGKLMVLDDDVKSNTILPDDWLKKLSEAKALSANPKGKSRYEFIARSIVVALTNHWPSTTDLSEGIRRRAQVLEMNYRIKESEKNPRHRGIIVSRELPGVLNHLVAGWQRVLARGCRFDPPQECEMSKRIWLAHSNTTARFVEQCVVRTGNPKDKVGALDVYGAYRGWLIENETQAKPLGRNTFYEKLDELGIQRVSFRRAWEYRGVVLQSENSEDDDW